MVHLLDSFLVAEGDPAIHDRLKAVLQFAAIRDLVLDLLRELC